MEYKTYGKTQKYFSPLRITTHGFVHYYIILLQKTQYSTQRMQWCFRQLNNINLSWETHNKFINSSCPSIYGCNPPLIYENKFECSITHTARESIKKIKITSTTLLHLITK